MNGFDDYQSNPFKSFENVSSFVFLVVSSATECALFEYEICNHISLKFDITNDFFRIRLSPKEEDFSLFFNFYTLNCVQMLFKVYIYTHGDHSSQVLFQFSFKNQLKSEKIFLSLQYMGDSSHNTYLQERKWFLNDSSASFQLICTPFDPE